MSRYELDSEGDELFEPGSGKLVLRNKLGIVDHRELQLAETRALLNAMDWSYQHFEDSTRFTISDICEMHRRWLGEIYGFAGKIRTVNVSKEGILFAAAQHLSESLDGLEALLARMTPCNKLGRADLVHAIASVHAEIILIHPFREGNGRLGRWLADLMAAQAGYPALRWRFHEGAEAARDEYFAALRRAFTGDLEALKLLVSAALTDDEGLDE